MIKDPHQQVERFMILAAAFLGLTGVAAGAFGAHLLTGRLSGELLSTFHTGAQYQMYHALALVGSAYAVYRRPGTWTARWSGYCFFLGVLIFSGSLYILALTGDRWIGAFTPIGGVLFLAGWFLLGISFVTR